MDKLLFLRRCLIVASLCVAVVACTKDEVLDLEHLNTSETKDRVHTISMKLIGNIVPFDKSKTRSDTISSWTEGDKIYIAFYNENTLVPGEAIYNSASGWSVSYDGNLATGENLKCEARYFVNATFSSAALVSINAQTEIYEDMNATYTFNDGALTVQATLSPKTGRIRFVGEPKSTIYVTGISAYTTFAPGINQFSTSNAMITSTVASNGSTPYIYGTFSNSDRNIGLVGSDFAYTRTCTSDVLKTGESGYMAIPSESSHNNWRTGLYVKANGVEFKMIPVAGHSQGFFMIGETEVTEELFGKINDGSSTSQKPKDYISYTEVTSFIEKLNNITKLNFSLPTSLQWVFAATGGDKSQNYTYSGSNTPGDVAWYTANSSSKQNVKTKAPNELGIYDMSGNVGEIVSDIFHSGYKYHYIYGGSYLSKVAYIENTSSVNYYYYIYSGGYMPSDAGYTNDSSCRSFGVGFRIILTIN